MKFLLPARVLAALCIFSPICAPVSAIDLDPTQPKNVKTVAKQVAKELIGFYAKEGPDGDFQILSGVPGLLHWPPYFWWGGGAMFGQLIEYWYYTGDGTYNDLVKEGIMHQIGEKKNLLPANQSRDIGNDDQLFWAFTVMSAAELNFTNPPDDKPGWLELAQSVMNQCISRFQEEEDAGTCKGGLRWQLYTWKEGYHYKNTPSNGGFFHLGARLAKYTGNATYARWANKVFDWMEDSPLLGENGEVNDGTDVKKDCGDADHTQWTYNYGMMLAGAAYMYNYTNGSDIWHKRVDDFLTKSLKFFPERRGKVMTEICEANEVCNDDQLSFKAYLSRWLATCAQLAPFTWDRIIPVLQHSGKAAAQSCVDGETGQKCGTRWWWEGFDGKGGVGQQMSALSIIAANLVGEVKPPYSQDTGGTSKGNPAAGTGDDGELFKPMRDITTADRAGAGILTVIAVSCILGGAWWLVKE